jgi:hypothetical protein
MDKVCVPREYAELYVELEKKCGPDQVVDIHPWDGPIITTRVAKNSADRLEETMRVRRRLGWNDSMF